MSIFGVQMQFVGFFLTKWPHDKVTYIYEIYTFENNIKILNLQKNAQQRNDDLD